MRTAIVSDIHGNLEAFQTVLADIEHRQVDEIVCLGDILGYGPNPLECVDLVAERCAWSLMGNHDYAVLYEPTNFNAVAKQAAHWARKRLDEAAEEDPEFGKQRLDFLSRIRVRVRYRDAYICVHGSVRKPINEYVFETDATDDPRKMKEIFERIEPDVEVGGRMVKARCLVGHTHVPGVFQWNDVDGADFTRASHLGGSQGEDEAPVAGAGSDALLVGSFTFAPDEKYIVNPGSVGQPRDLNEKASYAILDTSSPDHHVDFFRVPYDIDAVAEKIYDIPDLDDWLGDRLHEGR